MSRNDVELICELSPMQQAMLFASLYAPGSGVYVIQVSLRLKGRLDVAAFEQAWQRVVERHSVLRTGFHWEDLEKPLQVVLREVDLGLRRESWRGLSAEEQEARLREFLDADRESGFVLSEPPLMRLALFDLGADTWHLVWSLHHLLVDGWSVGLLLKELFSFYAGEPSPAYPRSYGDYIAWLQRQDASEAEAFWRRSLAGLTAPTLLAGSNGRGSGGFRRSQRRGVCLSADETAALRELAKRHRLTLNTLVQGAWALVAAQATGGADVVFGGTVAGRPGDLPGADSIVGLFINTLPVRVKVEPERLLLPWLEELQERQAEARRYEHAPLFEVQTWSDLPPGSALFDNILVFESYPLDSSLSGLLPDLSISGVSMNELTDYPVNLVVFPGSELSLELIHDTGRFDAPSAVRLLERLSAVLRSFAADPERRLGDIPFYIEAERHQVLAEWNDTASRYPRESVPALFAAVAEAMPEAPAVVESEEVWTYRRLDEASNRLAQDLAAQGVKPGARVGVAMERSADLIVAFLGVLKAGAAYVPLDPGYPEDRRAFMREDTGAEVVLDGRWSPSPTVETPRGASPVAEALAYIIYTSGSTGRPKGVAVPHQAIVRLVRETDYTQLSPGDRVAHLSNTSFDAATFEIWGALLNGATIVVVPREVALSPADLAVLLRRERVTAMFLTTALFNQMVREAPGAFDTLRWVLFGGEAVDPGLVARALKQAGPERLLHVYGPTESTTFATWHRVHEVPAGATTVPIGLPLANTTAYVLDTQGRPVPPGVAGELFVGGDGLAWGYWNRPELTAERFVPNPWEAGGRLYRTGDLVRQRLSGPVEFLGRLDQQVKIRGFRIEPGEIEAVLAAHPGVREAVVLARQEAGGLRLVAWVVPHPTDRTDPSDLSAWLRQKLPSYMVPSAFVLLDALPLTPNGKVDRRALPAPEQEPVEETAPPSDPVEELLAGILGEVLGRGRVGVHDDFFALGGHSLLATQVASRIRGVLGVELALRSVFEEPTVAGLARVVRAGLEGEGLQAPPITPVPRSVSEKTDLPLSFAQQRLWFIDQLDPGNPGYNIPAAVRLSGGLSAPRLAAALAGVVRRHEVLRTTFESRDGRAVQVIHPAGGVALPVVDLASLPDAARGALAHRLMVEESLWRFDLQEGPLLRAVLLRLASREHLLLLTLHHIVTDGWSMGLLVREAQSLYAGQPLPELPIQYADFAVWQRRWLAGEVLERQLAWWREQLAGTSGVLELPADHPRPAALSLRGAEHRFTLDRELSRRIAELGRREGATPFMILAAALFALLSRLSGQRDLNLGSPIANRNRIEIEGLIGFFVNTLVLRADVGRAEVFLDLLVQVREASLGGYAHQDLPFEKLVDEIQPERDLSRSPLVQVALAVNNSPIAPIGRAGMEGLRIAPEAPPSEVAKFDLAFILADTPEGCLAGSLQYATDLYEAPTAVRLTRQLAAFLDELTAQPEQPLADLSPLTAEERHQVLFEWNDTAEGPRSNLLLHQLFEAQAEARPEALAAVWEGEAWSYRELAERARRLAGLLRGLGIGRGTPVGVWMERSHHMLAGVLGILEAGGTYVPLDAAWPADRVETILEGTGAPAIFVSRAILPAVDRIRWRLPRLADTVCLDVEAPEPEPEPVDLDSVRSLFDFVSERATDRVTAGGFIHRDTGLPFTEAEVDEYRDRVLSLASPWLKPDARVLEVGSGSGLILWEMAKRVARCVGLDPSERTQERNRAEGIANVELPVGFAHEIGELFAPGSFDLVVLASTVQFFPGPRYLEKVVADALRLLAPGGALLIADVFDFDEDLFRDLGAAEILHRTEGFANELGERYDVILRPGEAQRKKRTWTGWHAAQSPALRLPAVASPEDIAYVIHTSGSTGLPKGIAVQHAPAVNLVQWVNRTFGVGPEDRLLFVTSLCFDLSVYDIFGTLAAGGTVHVASEAALREPGELVRLLRREPITIWDSAPAALQQLAPLFPEGPEREERPLRLVMLSGDWIPVPLPDQVRAAFPGTRVMSLGGATEATVWSNWYPVREVDPHWPSIPYGRPIANARYHVLDDGLLPCPIGVPGDLYIGGSCLCVGYAGQPDLTAAAFLPDPFAAEPGARLYRTGDRARFFRDGNLEFLGRVDQQVKIRGYRIELGEIEVDLLRHPAVREAVVAALDGRLVAYVVFDRTDRTDPTDPPDLSAWLRDRLPLYMLPSAFVTLTALPVTPNGKLDRKALPAPEQGQAESYEPPADEVEETLAGLWAEILGLERVGVRDNFFTLGGHSLLATQLMSRLRGSVGVELPLRELFEAPTIAELARTVRRVRQAGDATAPPPLLPVPREGDLPLSFAQQRLWFIDQLEPDSPVYNIFNAVRLRGAARRDLLQAGLEEVIRRHETLRTTFSTLSDEGGTPVQVIHAELPPDVAAVDLSGLPCGPREGELRRLAEAELLRPFDLVRGPLVRARFVLLGEDESAALLTLHHIVSDEWSMRVLIEELCLAYAALERGEAPALPTLRIQYADFAIWQRGWLRGEPLATELAYWRRHLAGAPELLKLPTDRPRPMIQSFRGTSLWQTLPAELTAALHAAGRERSATLFMTCLAAFQVLLGRVTGESEIVVGSPIVGRNHLETERLIGFFVNTLALRGSLSGRPSLAGLLARTRETVLAAHAHQDLPFELLVEALKPQRSLSHTPLFQVMMNLGTMATELSLPGISLAPVEGLRTGIAPFDLTLTVLDTGERLRLGFEYSTDLFDATTAERLLGYLGEVLRALVAAPETAAGEVALWSEAERHQVLTEWNDAVAEPVEGASLHGLVETWARRRPEAPAVLFEGGAWSYAELDGRAEGLARRLRRLGVGPEHVVGVQAGGGPELALGILGTLKAGGAFLPLDPSWPASRRASLLADAGARALAGCWDGEPDVGLPEGCAALRLDRGEPWSETGRIGPILPIGPMTPEQLAYVIYTSGSTGRPKGVMVGHGAAVRFAVEVAERCGLGEGERFLQFASPGFDVLIEEVFPVWARGGAVVFAPREELLTPAGLERVLVSQEVTGLELPTPFWQEWVDDLDRRGEAPPATLRRLLLGCEKPSLPRLARWGGHGVPLVHVFGLTETTVTSTLHRWDGREPVRQELPIGRPVGDAWLYVLDPEGAPVPMSVVGELFIGGAGVARGYLGRPDLTAERFVPDPFRAGPGARVYRTGDLARYRADGTLDFLGRIDEQVKVRGFRVEPGEIAAVLERHPSVSEAFVAVREPLPGDKRLVAWVVPAPGQAVSREALRSHVAARLPDYMVPAEVVELPELPRTANGKIDRAALPDPAWRAGARPGEGECPRTPVEELLAGVWCDVLGLEAVGRREDFFALGGHSLLATQVAARIRGVLGVDLPLRSLFERPTIAELACEVGDSRGGRPAPPLVPVPRPADPLQSDLPLSFAQQRLWLIDQLDPGTAAYNIPSAVRLSGEVDPALLVRIFAEVVRRHEALRTTFSRGDGGPVQIIAPPGTGAARLELPRIDLSVLPDLEREAEAAAIAREEAGRSFDLERGPLLRLLLVRLEEREHILLLTLHHIVSDGWSNGVLIQEVAALYDAFSRGQASPLPELPVQYADFAVWQRAWLRGEVLKEQLDWWRRHLAGAPQVLDLPMDRPRPAMQTFRGSTAPVELTLPLALEVRRFSRQEKVTPFMVLLAAWASLLGRYSGQEDVLVGSPIANRNRREIEDLIGFFVNTLVLRSDLSGNPSFRELLGRVRGVALEAFNHQDLPFERLVEELVPERDLSHSPLFQVMFVLQNVPGGALSIPGLTLAPLEVPGDSAKFDLLLNLIEGRDGELDGVVEYNTDLFDADRLARLTGHLRNLLAAAAADPGRPVSALPLLGEEERNRLLFEWSGSPAAWPRVCVHEPFEEQAERTPAGLAALWAEDGTGLTYRELNRRANQLAHHLRSLGVGPDERVAICLERSLDPLVAVLGVLKAGGAYVPIDPDYPADRAAFMLADSRSRVLVTTSKIAARLPAAEPETRRVLLDVHREALAACTGENPPCAVTPEHLAYVIYTSGSTGRPKGVAMPHRALANLLMWQRGVSEGGRTLQFASLSFDVSFQEIFSTWWTGGTVVALSQETRRDGAALCRVLREREVERLFLPFVALQQVAEAVERGAPEPAALREIVTAGEQLQITRQIAAWLERSEAFLENQYGPSEGHVVSAHRLAGDPAQWPDLPPIGRPLPNVRMYLLDRHFEPVPQGVPGHLCFGGAQVVRGYLDRPELTAAKLFPDPFGGEPGARLYATGDQARFLADGTLRFLGRIDQQVKIRGFRVEPGEVESALTRHPAVREAAVVVRGNGADRRLVGYYVASAPLAGGELRAFLAGELPDHMVPSALLRLDALPLTPSGKLDRRALPDPQITEEAGYVAPSNPVEELLAGIWAEVLWHDRVGVHDNFFALGGHSLLATQVVSRVREVLGVELPLRRIFETPTIAELARGLQHGAGSRRTLPIVARPQDSGEPALPLSLAQQRLWFIDQLQPGDSLYNVPLAVRLTGELSVDALERTFAELVRRHAVLRTTFALRGGQPVQVVAPPEAAPPELRVLDLSDAPDDDAREEWARELALEEARHPFDLARGPVLRLGLLRLGEREHLLLVTLHHIVSDGWSTGVLLREIGALYPAFLRGEPSPLPELPLQYADFARWQRSPEHGEVLERQLAYWKRKLAGAPALLEMPTDRPRPAVPTHRGAAVGLTLPPSLSAVVQEICRQEGATPFMLLLSAWAVLLGRHAGQEDVLTGSPIAGRGRREIEDLIGFFVNTLVLRSDLSGAPSFRELLGRVRETTLEAFAHQDVPFERLVEELAPARDLAVSPLIQVVFVVQNAPQVALEVPGLVLEPVEVEAGIAKFDLTLAWREEPSGFSGALEYSADLFDGSTAERLLARFSSLLEAAVLDPGLSVAELPLLPPAERHQALMEWNDTAASFPREASLPELFEEVARELPEAPAVVTLEGEVWSYRRLDEASSRLARRLRALGVGLETPVGLCLERSPGLILGTLAILKAGGVYVPLDAGHPDERLAFLLEDTGARVVLVDERTRERFAGPVRPVLVDGEDRAGDGHGSSGPRIPSASLSYLIYTSGSTGRPKGVAVPHRAVARLVRGASHLTLGPGDRLAFNANPSFDAATFEIWAALLSGAALVVIPQSLLLSPADLAASLERERVTVLHLTAALFALVAREAPEALAGPRCVLFGGEASAPAAVARALEEGRPQRLLHMYGPTESTTFATYEPVAEVLAEASTVPVGRPLANTSVYLLDRSGQQVPPGAAGELLLGGDGLARGYWNRPELTAARFVPHPWGLGERLYRTGDLVRQRPDGRIEILGRLDDQVKIRGFRIEPGEIEAVLAAHPDVRESVVLARRDDPGASGETRLVAYVAGHGRGLRGEDLRAWLLERLPEHMLPAVFILLEKLPLTPNGKVDRQALPVPQGADVARGSGREYVAPSDPIEGTLAEIWADVLRLDRVGVNDNFFSIGGHSLLATQLMSRMREALDVDLPLRALFAAPTIAELARTVREARRRGASAALPPLGPRARDAGARDLPLSFSQQRLWFLDQLEPGSPAYNVPMAVRLTGELSVEALERTFAEVVRRHEALRTTFAVRGGQPVQVISPPEAMPPELRVLDLSDAPEEAREEWAAELALEEARAPFDLERGPLLRLGLLRLGEQEHLLLVTLHHIVSDGWSMGVLLRETGALYPAFLRGEPSPLPELPLQYADFALWQRSWLQGEVLERQLAHWKAKLDGAPALLELPIDRPRPATQTHRGASVGLTLEPALTAAIRDLCRKEEVTPYMLLLAAWAALLGRHAGQEDVLVGSPIAGRHQRESEELIGFFVNTLVLRVDLAGATFRELLGRVRETALDAFAHQDLPFDLLVDELGVERSLAHNPLIQVILALQNAPAGELRIPGLTFSPVSWPSSTAKLDLALGFHETAEGFGGGLEYATDLFDRATIERLLGHLTNLLGSAVEDPGRPLSELRLMDAAEERLLLTGLNGLQGAERTWALTAAVHDLFTRQAERTPGKAAAVGPQGEMTYREIEERSTALAGRLRSPRLDRRIGLLCDPDPQVLIGMIGILKSGSGFVPIDPRQPDERLAWILEDSACEALVTQRRYLERVERLAPGLLILCLEDALPSKAEPQVAFDPRSLAYIVYTSGSTGRPKGVQVSHESLVPMLLWGCGYFGLGENTRALQSLSFFFDFGIFEHLTTVLAGGTLYFPGEAAGDPAAFARKIVRLGINTLHTTPAFAQALSSAGQVLDSLEIVHLGGEALSRDTVARLREAAPRAVLYNGYGPTEATVNSSIFSIGSRIEGEDAEWPVVPIGRRSADNALYILDRAGRLVPFGARGELYVGGIGVARGYLNRPDLTAERFVPDPFGAAPGGRLYRTGDLVRYLPGGDIEFLGRIDHQVKLRGFRIELGEIEAVLRSHRSVQAAVVLVREEAGGGRIVAWVVLDPKSKIENPTSVLSDWVRAKVPEYMVPSAFVILEALPLTPTGKVDRKALPAPERGAGSSAYVAPGDAVEEKLADIWQEVLRLDRVGVHDNFFAIGGHSLLATQVATRVRETLGVDLPLRRVFESPTVSRLARDIRAAREAGSAG